MCFAQSAPKPPPPPEPLKAVDEAGTNAAADMRKKMLLAKGLESTWTRGPLNPGSAAGSGKSLNLGGTK